MLKTIISTADMEEVARGIIDAINDRDFSLDSPAWAHVAPSWTSHMFPLTPDPERKAFNLSEHLEICEKMVQLYPNYRMHSPEMTTYLSEQTGVANVYCNFKVEGIEPGIVRMNMGIIKFRYMDGRWLASGYRAAMDVTGVPALE